MSENNTDLNEQYGESSFEAFQDARDVDKAFNEWVVKNNIYWGVLPLNTVTKITTDMKAFAKFYAKRCGIDVGNECVHCHKSKLIEKGVCNCCGGDQ